MHQYSKVTFELPIQLKLLARYGYMYRAWAEGHGAFLHSRCKPKPQQADVRNDPCILGSDGLLWWRLGFFLSYLSYLLRPYSFIYFIIVTIMLYIFNICLREV